MIFKKYVFNILIIFFSLFFLFGCGSSQSKENHNSPLIDTINSYRTKGVTCSNKLYVPTHKLTTVDDYKEGYYDYDALYVIGSDEPLESLFDDAIRCGYLFGEFTQFVGYDGGDFVFRW